MRLSDVSSWRNNNFIQFIKPPDPTFNSNRKRLNKLIGETLSKDGKVLDLGSGGRKLHDRIINFDLSQFNHVDIVGNAHFLPFNNNSFDFIIATAVLEHVMYPQVVVDEIYRCLAINGMVYAETPFLQGFHSDPHDYQRYTLTGLKVLFEKFEERDSGVCVGPVSVLTWYIRKFPTIFFKNKLVNKMIEFITGWLFFVFKYLDILFSKASNAHSLASGLYFLSYKK